MQIIPYHKIKCWCPTPSSTSGFTLIELVLSVAIIGIVAVSIGSMIIGGAKHYDLVVKRKASLSEVRLALDRMCYEIALILDTNNIVTFTVDNFTFNTPSEDNIQYTLNGGSLMRGGAVLADNATSLAFTYLDADGNPTGLKANIRRIGIEISASAGAPYGTLYVRDQVFPRRFSSAYAGFQ